MKHLPSLIRMAIVAGLVAFVWACAHSPGPATATVFDVPMCELCSVKMESGYVEDAVDRYPGFYAIEPVYVGATNHAVITYRCPACGLLRSYAP